VYDRAVHWNDIVNTSARNGPGKGVKEGMMEHVEATITETGADAGMGVCRKY